MNKKLLVLSFAAIFFFLFTSLAVAATVTISKPDWGDPNVYKDCITPNVCITRGIDGPIYNSVLEPFGPEYGCGSTSPYGTEWAMGTCDAPRTPFNYFITTAQCAPPYLIIGQDMCLHLISEDIYLNIRFHSWTSGGGGGGFSYTRTNEFSLTDTDGDGISDNMDNCILKVNPTQIDSNNDGYGNVCDADFNNNCIINIDDADILANSFGSYCSQSTCGIGYDCWGNFSGCSSSDYPFRTWNPDADLNTDGRVNILDAILLANVFGGIPGPSGLNNICQTNHDEDGVPDVIDNCMNIYNPDQLDTDSDGIGDVCDICVYDPQNDIDQDTICGNVDNCPNSYNPAQEDFDLDGIGDVCDSDDDGDGVLDINDMCPYEDATGFDADHNGCIDTIEGLTDVIQTLPPDVLSDEIKNSLASKVDNALKSISKENDDTAVNQLQAFINQILAQRGKKISEEAADMLIAYANNLIAKIRAG